MLTRIEIDGFKTFRDLKLDMGFFTGVIGANAAGKSNFFDAIQFLRRITESSLTEAVQASRGDLEDLFRLRGDGSRVDTIDFAVEVLLDPTVRDPWGMEVALTQTLIRYELRIVRREDEDGNQRLFVEHEQATPIRRGQRDLASRWKASSFFADRFIVDGRRTSPFLETKASERGQIFQIRQDGVQGRARPADAAEATVLSSMSSAEFKHLYALNREIAGWRFLQLEPEALREPGERYGAERLAPDGSNLSRVLHRIQRETATESRPLGALADISADLAQLIPGMRGVRVVENEQTRKWETHILTDGGATYRADVASDGTLRVLALLAAMHDPKYRGLVCFEEPENGVHPLQLRTLIAYLSALVTDPSLGVEDSAPLSQVIVNSHSPVVLASLRDSQCVYVDTQTVVERVETGGRATSKVSRFRAIAPYAQGSFFDESLPEVSKPEIERYRAAAQLEGTSA